jgi:hypothetical protein
MVNKFKKIKLFSEDVHEVFWGEIRLKLLNHVHYHTR